MLLPADQERNTIIIYLHTDEIFKLSGELTWKREDNMFKNKLDSEIYNNTLNFLKCIIYPIKDGGVVTPEMLKNTLTND